METKTEHPFKPGVRVAIHDGWNNWREGHVDKVYKTGRFTLIGSSQQWRPSAPWSCDKSWRAHETNRSYSRTSLRLWDAATDSEIKEAFDQQARKVRHRKLIGRLERLRDSEEVTDAMLDQIEAALPPIVSANPV